MREFPIRAIVYNASSVNSIDNYNSFEFWVRGYLIRIVGDKAFSRGDMCEIVSIEKKQDGKYINIRVLDDEEFDQNLPTLMLATSRLVYNDFSSFEISTRGDIEVLDTIEVTSDNNLSLSFITLVGKGYSKIQAVDSKFENFFDIELELSYIDGDK